MNGTSQDPFANARSLVTRVVVGQASVTLLLALVAVLFDGVRAGGSAALGGGIGAATTLYMASRALDGDADDAQVMLRRFVRAEVLKVGLTVFLFVVAFKFLPVSPPWLLGGYAATYAA